jgi:hypothetical protein
MTSVVTSGEVAFKSLHPLLIKGEQEDVGVSPPLQKGAGGDFVPQDGATRHTGYLRNNQLLFVISFQETCHPAGADSGTER